MGAFLNLVILERGAEQGNHVIYVRSLNKNETLINLKIFRTLKEKTLD